MRALENYLVGFLSSQSTKKRVRAFVEFALLPGFAYRAVGAEIVRDILAPIVTCATVSHITPRALSSRSAIAARTSYVAELSSQAVFASINDWVEAFSIGPALFTAR